MTVQTTFTKQKRALAKANELIQSLRAQEVIIQRLSPNGALETEERSAYMVRKPEEIAQKVLEIVETVVQEHGARQKANSSNRGRFEFAGIQADLTVPQLRTLQDATTTLASLISKLPQENLAIVPNGEYHGSPAFLAPLEEHKDEKIRYVPFEDSDSTRVRTYEEKYEELQYSTRKVTIDRGLKAEKILQLKDLLEDLQLAIQVAIDEANTKPHDEDAELKRVIAGIKEKFQGIIG